MRMTPKFWSENLKKKHFEEIGRDIRSLIEFCSGRQWITSASTWTKFHHPEGGHSMSIDTLVLSD
jgi:hypothetical protein